jgi:hypothetical protein
MISIVAVGRRRKAMQLLLLRIKWDEAYVEQLFEISLNDRFGAVAIRHLRMEALFEVVPAVLLE